MNNSRSLSFILHSSILILSATWSFVEAVGQVVSPESSVSVPIVNIAYPTCSPGSTGYETCIGTPIPTITPFNQPTSTPFSTPTPNPCDSVAPTDAALRTAMGCPINCNPDNGPCVPQRSLNTNSDGSCKILPGGGTYGAPFIAECIVRYIGVCEEGKKCPPDAKIIIPLQKQPATSKECENLKNLCANAKNCGSLSDRKCCE